jgi:hypothetical protein
MKMNPFKADTQAALDKTRRKLADVQANIAALEASRAEKLSQTGVKVACLIPSGVVSK